MRRLTGAVLGIALVHGAGSAQTAATLPEPATDAVPDLSGSGEPEVVSNGWKYFFFRRAGVAFATAHADFTDCFRFLGANNWATVKLGRFVPWNSRPGQKPASVPNNFGLVGAVMQAMVEGTLARRDYQAKMRRCMEPRGYTRYGVAEKTWESVTAMPPEQAIPILAKIASGPDFGGKVPSK